MHSLLLLERPDGKAHGIRMAAPYPAFGFGGWDVFSLDKDCVKELIRKERTVLKVVPGNRTADKQKLAVSWKGDVVDIGKASFILETDKSTPIQSAGREETSLMAKEDCKTVLLMTHEGNWLVAGQDFGFKPLQDVLLLTRRLQDAESAFARGDQHHFAGQLKKLGEWEEREFRRENWKDWVQSQIPQLALGEWASGKDSWGDCAKLERALVRMNIVLKTRKNPQKTWHEFLDATEKAPHHWQWRLAKTRDPDEAQTYQKLEKWRMENSLRENAQIMKPKAKRVKL